MPIEVKVPEVGESITEVEIASWLKAEGDTVEQDEDMVSIETEKASVDLPAPVSGTLTKILKKKGERAKVGETIAQIDPNGQLKRGKREGPSTAKAGKDGDGEEVERAQERKAASETRQDAPDKSEKSGAKGGRERRVMPAAKRLLEEHGLEADEVDATGPGERLLKEDVLRHLEAAKPEARLGEAAPATSRAAPVSGREEEVVPMSPLRRTVARRLVEAQQTMAMLTTFNEIDMSAVAALRREYQEAFMKKHEVKLGLTSFFVKAVIEALKTVPQINAEVRGEDIVYRNYYDIGVAIGGGRGLVVPVLRNAERLSFAEVEKAVSDFAARAKGGKLKLEELQGGTFTITNGGVFGSLLSTPIINPPQSGILGLHAIQDRPMAVAGEVVIRPMMYVALTYDHRVVDGREAVTFLKRVKETVESPARMLLEA